MTQNYYETTKTVRPILMVQNTVVFPGETTYFDLDSEEAERTVEYAAKQKQKILLITGNGPFQDPAHRETEGTFGTVIDIHQSVRVPGGYSKVLVEGLFRSRLTQIARREPILEGEVQDYIYHPEKLRLSERDHMIIQLTAKEAISYFKNTTSMPESFLTPLVETMDPGKLGDQIAHNLGVSLAVKLEILQETDVIDRLILIQRQLSLQQGLAKLDQELMESATERLQQSQKEYLLREQMNIIKEELGDGGGDPDSLVDYYTEKIEELDLDEEVEEPILREIERLGYVPQMSPEMNVTRTYLDTILDLPWHEYTKETKDIAKSRKILDRHHYGLKEVKERILEFIAVRQLRDDSKGSILCLVGPPGVGKTSIVRSIAEALGRKFTSMRLGGVTDESEIRGHRRTYIGSMPGRIISQMIKAESMNPVFLFDEVDKIGSDFRGDPASALLEVLDPEQNNSFQDRYLEIPFDLSRVMFVTTANSMDTIPAPLLDRMEVIRIPGYTDREKYEIARRFLLPKQRKEAGLMAKQLSVSKGVMEDIIYEYTREAGVRELERQIGKICRRAAKQIVEGKKKVAVSKRNLVDFLGEAKYRDELIDSKPGLGTVNGLAWTEVGGEILRIEANLMDGHGLIQLTGSMGDVMKESAQTAISFIRANAKRYGIFPGFHAIQDIHIHMPEGAVPKDGPSAGVSMATALVSILTKRPVRNDIAMTGEITLLGKVLPIGGVKEKVLAAKRYHIKTVLLPKENLRDWKELEEEVRENLRVIPVETMDDVLREALLDPVEVSTEVVFQEPHPNGNLGFYLPTGKGGEGKRSRL